MAVYSKAPRCILLILIIVVAVDSFEDSALLEEENEDFSDDFLPVRKPLVKEVDHEVHCCVREKRMKKVGTSVTGENLTVDVGHCRKRCPSKKPLKKKRFQKLLRENPNMDPRELFLLHSGRRERQPSCPQGQACTGIESRMERVMTSEGELSVDIVESCSCQQVPRTCRRTPKIEVFHKGTPLEADVDIGECRGYCGQETKCKPISQKTTSIEGPNGSECVSVVEDCGCASPCYRKSHYQHFYDYSDGSPTVKVVDIGRCVGECPRQKKDHCILRKEEDNGCLMSLSQDTSSCLPLALMDNGITDEDGTVRNITSISTCGCR